MRLGIFGGAFDPVHLGHLLAAESFREQCRLDQVWLVPTAASPHKEHAGAAPARDRVEMLRLATGGHEALRVSTIEVDRGGISYTAETLEAIHRELPDAELLLLLGADMYHDLPNWRDPQRICELATPVAIARPGYPPPSSAALLALVPPARRDSFRPLQVESPLVEISSSEIRRRAAAGLSIRYRVPRAVEKYIEAQGLYRAGS